MSKQTIDLHELMELMRERQPESERRGGVELMDALLKIFIGVCTALMVAGMIWLISSVSSLKNDFAVLAVQQKGYERMMTRFEDFTQKPRFTHEDFHSNMAPILQKITANENTIVARGVYLEETKVKINSMLNDLRNLHDDITEMKEMLKDAKK